MSHTKYQKDSGSVFPYVCPLCKQEKPAFAERYIPTGVASQYGPAGDPICPDCYNNPPRPPEKRKRKKRDLDD